MPSIKKKLFMQPTSYENYPTIKISIQIYAWDLAGKSSIREIKYLQDVQPFMKLKFVKLKLKNESPIMTLENNQLYGTLTPHFPKHKFPMHATWNVPEINCSIE